MGFLGISASVCWCLGWLDRDTFENGQAIFGLDSIWITDEGGNGVPYDREFQDRPSGKSNY